MDEAVLKIVVKDENSTDIDAGPPESVDRGAQPRPSSVITPTSQPVQQTIPAQPSNVAPSSRFDPRAEAEKMREAEIRREQIKATYDKLYGVAEETETTFDVMLGMAKKMRGTLGAAFGTLVGSILDEMAGVQ